VRRSSAGLSTRVPWRPPASGLIVLNLSIGKGSASAPSALSDQDRARRGQPDRDGDFEHHRRRERDRQRAEDDVEGALEHVAPAWSGDSANGAAARPRTLDPAPERDEPENPHEVDRDRIVADRTETCESMAQYSRRQREEDNIYAVSIEDGRRSCKARATEPLARHFRAVPHEAPQLDADVRRRGASERLPAATSPLPTMRRSAGCGPATREAQGLTEDRRDRLTVDDRDTQK